MLLSLYNWRPLTRNVNYYCRGGSIPIFSVETPACAGDFLKSSFPFLSPCKSLQDVLLFFNGSVLQCCICFPACHGLALPSTFICCKIMQIEVSLSHHNSATALRYTPSIEKQKQEAKNQHQRLSVYLAFAEHRTVSPTLAEPQDLPQWNSTSARPQAGKALCGEQWGLSASETS